MGIVSPVAGIMHMSSLACLLVALNTLCLPNMVAAAPCEPWNCAGRSDIPTCVFALLLTAGLLRTHRMFPTILCLILYPAVRAQ